LYLEGSIWREYIVLDSSPPLSGQPDLRHVSLKWEGMPPLEEGVQPFLVRSDHYLTPKNPKKLKNILKVNVMEALEVMQKTNKSFYKWHGLDRLPELMFALQRDAQKGELPIKIAKVEKAMCSFTTNFNLNFNEEKIKLKEEKHSTEELPEDEEEDSAFGPLTSRDRCGKNSLAQLCRRFLMVLLCNPNRAVSLDVVR